MLLNTYTKDGGQLLENSLEQISSYFLKATELSRSWHKAWHSWAIINFEAIEHYKQMESEVNPLNKSNAGDRTSKTKQRIIKQHLQNAAKGFVKSIALSPGKNLQDTLRLLTLFFQYPTEVSYQFMEGLDTLNVDLWLQVIPQIIARIQSNLDEISKPLQNLLTRIGQAHPQALVYPISVAATSHMEERKHAARGLMNNMKKHNAALVDQADLVATELIRVAILWPEMWHEGLEDASRLYFGDHNVIGMLDRLQPLQEAIQRGATTTQEATFEQAFSADLNRAWEWCLKYRRTSDINHINKAWEIYYQVFRHIDKQLPSLTRFELQYVSPLLEAAANLDLAVPGTYKPGKPLVKIATFEPTLKVITSKQRPRKLTIYGSDGLDWNFLLKGHEDLRQDERVMQLFGLVNTLLKREGRTRHMDLAIQRYAVIPLSPHSGLIKWVPDSDTLHHLIRDYRQTHKITLNQEHKDMTSKANTINCHFSIRSKFSLRL